MDAVRSASVLGVLLLGLTPVAGCDLGAAGTTSPTPTGSPDPSPGTEGPPPALGGPVPARVEPPRRPMDALERPVAEELGGMLADQGLTLEYLDCPRWDGTMPAQLDCTGYLDGVRGRVQVALAAGEDGSVAFDAALQHGVIATANLVDELVEQGYSEVDCGGVPAYPTRVGDTFVCAVTDGGQRRYVDATVTDRTGAVDIVGSTDD